MSIGHRRLGEGNLKADVALVSAVREGQTHAFRSIYDRYSHPVYDHCLRLTGSTANAEDLAALVFLEAWRRRKDYRLVEGSAGPWLHGIAYNLARNHWRAAKRHRQALDRIAETRVEPDHADEVVERVAAEQAIRNVLAELRSLPSQDREVIELCVAADLSYAEAADLLGVPVGTIKSRLSRALAKLRASSAIAEIGEELR